MSMSNYNSMNTTAETIKELQNKCLLQEQQIAELTAKLSWYEEQFHLGQQKRYGRSSEQTNHPQ
ncbi:MAG: transposase, partial [Syntrophaceticus sp.]